MSRVRFIHVKAMPNNLLIAASRVICIAALMEGERPCLVYRTEIGEFLEYYDSTQEAAAAFLARKSMLE